MKNTSIGLINIKNLTIRARQGNREAQFSLGVCYATGNSIKKDMKQAFDWYLKSATQGMRDAQINLAVCYRFGEGTAINYDEAFKWFQKAADQGAVSAKKALGECYYYAAGVPKDISRAVYWFAKAANEGCETSRKNLKLIMRNPVERALINPVARTEEKKPLLKISRDAEDQKIAIDNILETMADILKNLNDSAGSLKKQQKKNHVNNKSIPALFSKLCKISQNITDLSLYKYFFDKYIGFFDIYPADINKQNPDTQYHIRYFYLNLLNNILKITFCIDRYLINSSDKIECEILYKFVNDKLMMITEMEGKLRQYFMEKNTLNEFNRLFDKVKKMSLEFGRFRAYSMPCNEFFCKFTKKETLNESDINNVLIYYTEKEKTIQINHVIQYYIDLIEFMEAKFKPSDTKHEQKNESDLIDQYMKMVLEKLLILFYIELLSLISQFRKTFNTVLYDQSISIPDACHLLFKSLPQVENVINIIFPSCETAVKEHYTEIYNVNSKTITSTNSIVYLQEKITVILKKIEETKNRFNIIEVCNSHKINGYYLFREISDVFLQLVEHSEFHCVSGRCYEATKDYSMALKHYEKAVEKNHPAGMFLLAKLRLKTADHLSPDIYDLFYRAADMGCMPAKLVMAELYHSGAGMAVGVPCDRQLAILSYTEVSNAKADSDLSQNEILMAKDALKTLAKKRDKKAEDKEVKSNELTCRILYDKAKKSQLEKQETEIILRNFKEAYMAGSVSSVRDFHMVLESAVNSEMVKSKKLILLTIGLEFSTRETGEKDRQAYYNRQIRELYKPVVPVAPRPRPSSGILVADKSGSISDNKIENTAHQSSPENDTAEKNAGQTKSRKINKAKRNRRGRQTGSKIHLKQTLQEEKPGDEGKLIKPESTEKKKTTIQTVHHVDKNIILPPQEVKKEKKPDFSIFPSEYLNLLQLFRLYAVTENINEAVKLYNRGHYLAALQLLAKINQSLEKSISDFAMYPCFNQDENIDLTKKYIYETAMQLYERGLRESENKASPEHKPPQPLPFLQQENNFELFVPASFKLLSLPDELKQWFFLRLKDISHVSVMPRTEEDSQLNMESHFFILLLCLLVRGNLLPELSPVDPQKRDSIIRELILKYQTIIPFLSQKPDQLYDAFVTDYYCTFIVKYKSSRAGKNLDNFVDNFLSSTQTRENEMPDLVIVGSFIEKLLQGKPYSPYPEENKNSDGKNPTDIDFRSNASASSVSGKCNLRKTFIPDLFRTVKDSIEFDVFLMDKIILSPGNFKFTYDAFQVHVSHGLSFYMPKKYREDFEQNILCIEPCSGQTIDERLKQDPVLLFHAPFSIIWKNSTLDKATREAIVRCADYSVSVLYVCFSSKLIRLQPEELEAFWKLLGDLSLQSWVELQIRLGRYDQFYPGLKSEFKKDAPYQKVYSTILKKLLPEQQQGRFVLFIEEQLTRVGHENGWFSWNGPEKYQFLVRMVLCFLLREKIKETPKIEGKIITISEIEKHIETILTCETAKKLLTKKQLTDWNFCNKLIEFLKEDYQSTRVASVSETQNVRMHRIPSVASSPANEFLSVSLSSGVK